MSETGENKSGMSRRDFAKASAIGTFAILSANAAKAQANSDTLKVGLLGCGGRGSGAALNMLQGQNNVQLVALADLFEDRLTQTRRRFENSKDEAIAKQVNITDDRCFVGFNAYKQILATDIDILIEGTLPYSRPTHLEAAVEAGKHIFTEKPFAVDPYGIRKVIAAAEKHKAAGLSWVSGTQRRHHPSYQETIKKIHDGAIGDVAAMRVYWCGSLPFVRERKEGQSDFEYRVRNWINYQWTSGDNIVEQHVHNLDIACWVLDSHPVKVYASGGRVWKPEAEKYGDMFDHFSCDYEFPDGKHVFSFSRHWDGTEGHVFEQAFGSEGSSMCHDLSDSKRPQGDAYVIEHQDLCKSIRGEGPYWHQGVETAHSTLTAIMGRVSAYTGKSVTWDEALSSDLKIVPDEWSFEKEYPVGPVPDPVDHPA